MLFVILGRDRPDSASARAEARPAHLQRLERLRDDGHLLLAGPLPDAEPPDGEAPRTLGSLIVAEFPTFDDARAWAEEDPYRAAGVYATVEIFPFKKVLP